MPMVDDYSPYDQTSVRLERSGYPSFTRIVQTGRKRAQRGYRSGGAGTPYNWADRNDFLKWGQERRLINALTVQEYTTAQRRQVLVNDRDYTEDYIELGRLPWFASLQADDGSILGVSGISAHRAWGFAPGWFPSQLSETIQRNIAGSLLRSAAPTKPEIDLFRSLGELKDAPLMFRAANYFPRNPAQAGGAFLNVIFGLVPTISDAQRVASTVVDSIPIITAFLDHDEVRLRRSREQIVWNDSGSVSYTTRSTGVSPSAISSATLGSRVRWEGYGLPSGNPSRGDVLGYSLNCSWVGIQKVRAFATWEYFIPRPAGLRSRLQSYKDSAERLMGGGLTLSSAYELTPWSWLVDWFADVGGLLQYQQQVADYGLVMSLCGTTLVEEAHANVTISPVFVGGTLPKSHTLRYMSEAASGTNYRFRRLRRRTGSPYSIGPTWDFTSQQWAILAALGLARSSGVRF